jgi:copper chaperone CopZ
MKQMEGNGMKQILVGIHLLALALFSVSPSAAEVSTAQASTLVITGMAPGSADKVQKALEALPGVAQVKVSEEEGLAVVVYDPAKIKTEEFTRAMQEAGYLATFAKVNFRCPTCPATYAEAGECIVDGSTLEALS